MSRKTYKEQLQASTDRGRNSGRWDNGMSRKINSKAMPLTNQGRISDRWDNATEAQKQKRKAQYDTETANYERQMEQAGQQYAGMRNQASAGHAMQQRAMRERMANMGLSAAGGTSRTHAQRASNSLANEIGSIGRQEQDHADNIDLAIGNLGTQYNADIAAIEAGNEAQKNAEQLAYEQWKAGQDLQREQHETAKDQWRQQFAASQNDSRFNQLYQMYAKRLISKRQMKEMLDWMDL